MCPLTLRSPATQACENSSTVNYVLGCHVLNLPEVDPCLSYDLTVTTPYESVSLKDLSIRSDRIVKLIALFLEEEVLPENLPWIAEDLLADPDFVD
ncbi:MAG: hypothetical protein J6M12_01205 [Clostridia bacterium]|nr:hypothetical protein [Clostridia bacterium]